MKAQAANLFRANPVMCFIQSTNQDNLNQEELQEVLDNIVDDDGEDQEFIEDIQDDLDDPFLELINEILKEGNETTITLEEWRAIGKDARDKILEFCNDELDGE